MVPEQVRGVHPCEIILIHRYDLRRAKAKLIDGKHKTRNGSTETSPDTPPELSTGFEVDLHNLIHEDERER
jgi:hypothetical protein